jgi:beta-galactosidase
MKKVLVCIWLATVAAGVLVAAPAEPARVTVSFDANWRFLKADSSGAEQPQFDDRAWRKLDVPHDWSIEGPFSETNKTGGSGGFLPSGVGWYRKHFSLSKGEPGRRVFIEFDGVMQNSDVWINGFHLGHRPYGYVSFSYELTGHVNFGGDNVIAVRADTSDQPASRWYSGAGIYRHVRLVETTPVHVSQWGTFVSTPQVSDAQAAVHVQVAVTNEYNTPAEIFLKISVLDPDGKIVAGYETKPQMIAPGTAAPFEQDLIVKNPRRWDLEHPVLYQARVEVKGPVVADSPAAAEKPALVKGGMMFDDNSVPFGIREFHFDPATGFWLNGKNFKIKGVCLHHDGGAFGAAVPLGVWEERLKTLKSLGVNAIRTAHNPPAPEFLDLCDRLGFLVMDEMFDCWTVAKNPYDYHLYFNEWSKTDERDTIRRDRNHPGIILYSVGNEIHDTPKAELAKGILQGLVEVAHEADPTRPVTQALFRPNVSHDYDNGLADMLDVVGQNYRENEILAAHEQKPSRKIIGTENRHERAAWVALRDHAPYAGQFLWSGIDYLGESRRWPVVAAGSGLLDHTGAPKPMAFERQSWWSDKPMVFITRRIAPNAAGPTDPGYEPATQDALRRPQILFPDWTPKNSTPHDENVEVYSNCKDVELFLNGKSLGSKPLNADASPRIWKVVYTPGTLKAVARNNDRVVATDELRTAGPPAKIQLSVGRADPALRDQDAQQRVPTDRIRLTADWNEVAFVRATVVDAHGVVVPGANDLISFKISGPGVIAAVDSADNASHEPFQAGERHAFQGKCVAFVKASAPSGKMVVTASAPGLKSDEVVIKACPPASAP